MKIVVKLFASLSYLLPADSRANSMEVEVADNATANQIIDLLQLPRKKVHLVLRNGLFVEPQDRDLPLIKEGDAIAFWPPIAGG
jgi:molybdopterin converting factor small subunit